VIVIVLLAGLAVLLVTNSVLHPVARAYSAGPPPGYTRAPGEEPEACAECHVPDSGAGSGQISINVPATYIPGQTYLLAVTHTNSDPSRRRWGFQLTALDTSDEKAGNLQSINALTQVLNNAGPGNSRQYIEHTSAGTFIGQQFNAVWTFNWTAPATYVGPVTFYAAGNQANNDGNTSGDFIYFTSNQSLPASSGNDFSFSSPSYSVGEGANAVAITVNRTGDTSSPASVRYATSDATDVNFNCNPNTSGQIIGAASRKCDYHIAAGRLRFAPGETSKQIILSVINDVYVEQSEILNITLSSPTGATLGTTSSAAVIISDDAGEGGANPIDGTAFYVRMLYVDLLSREPEASGLAGWVHRIDFCGQPNEPPPHCDRVTVGGDGFLRSAEFFDREFYVIRLYRTGLGRILRYDDVADLAYVSGFLSDADLELNKQELVNDIMARSEFASIYNSLSNAQYVDTLIQTAVVTLPPGVRDGWVNSLNSSAKTRAQIYRELSERQEVSNKYLHEAQVVSCYYGFFTRNPDGAYFNYLQRLDSGEINLGDLANAFINAAEYRQRFGP
ncbi:MAG TPA: choice-of-anchor V domain-containing protein, partial [Pyrinomonadaceae bacterium]|nr:choice-of-anchor V domain-containing protein [Pyrinomonadaceae bacterium]